jgi:hypothetical protein
MTTTVSSLFFTGLLADADTSQWGWLAGAGGGLLGALVGLGGGVFGTYCSIKTTRTAMERRFMIRYSVVIWLAVISLVLLPVALSEFGLIPVWLQWGLFTLFFLTLVPSILWANQHQAHLRAPQGPTPQP